MPSVESVQGEEANEEKTEQHIKPVVGIIYPPPEVRNIVDKTASFVARNGLEFETRIRQNETNNPKFNFLNGNDPYHAYYQHKLKEFREGNVTTEPPTSSILQEQQQQQQQQQKQQQSLQSQITETFVPKEPPPAPQFVVDPPSISAFDLDLVKLTALFVARNGRQFLTSVMNREHNNYQFDFLKPQHSLFQYFTKLVEQYTNVLIPPKDIVHRLKVDCSDPFKILNRVKYAVNWTKYKEEQRQKEEAEQDRERIAFAQIDWHDFVVVETVPFKDDEKDNLPQPVTPEELGIRIIAQQRYEEEQRTTAIEMDVDEDDQDGSPPPPPPNEADGASMPPPLPPVANAVVKKDYDPKTIKQAPAQPPTHYVISPLTNERIPADKVDQHMRYALLDPKWREDREKAAEEKVKQTEIFAIGGHIGDHLKSFASRRTDIFGAADEETIIGKKIGEDELARVNEKKVIWDGHSSTMGSVTRAARAIVTGDNEMTTNEAKGPTSGTDEKFGPGITSTSSEKSPQSVPRPPAPPHHLRQPMAPAPPLLPPMSAVHHHPMPRLPSNDNAMKPMPGSFSHPPPPGLPPPVRQPPRPTPPNFMPPAQPPPPGQAGFVKPPSSTVLPPGAEPVNANISEPVAKKLKPDAQTGLIPEQQFLAANASSVVLKVQVPAMPEKNEWKLNGQVISFTIPLTDQISVVKAKVHELIGLPPGKQKLQIKSTFVKDSFTLGYYNVTSSTVIQLQLKERGGRKK